MEVFRRFSNVPKETHRIYSEIAHTYDSNYTDLLCRTEDTFLSNYLLERIPSGARILDVGCGTGLLIRLLKIPPDRYLGIDPSEGMLAFARQKYPEHKFMATSAEQIARSSEVGKFDAIVGLFGVFSYIDNPIGTLCDLVSIMNPTGSFIMMSYTHRHQSRAIYNRRFLGSGVEIPKRTFYSKAEFARVLTHGDFVTTDIQGFSGPMLEHYHGRSQVALDYLCRLEAQIFGRMFPDKCYFLLGSAIKGGLDATA